MRRRLVLASHGHAVGTLTPNAMRFMSRWGLRARG